MSPAFPSRLARVLATVVTALAFAPGTALSRTAPFGPGAAPEPGRVVVFAASSLEGVFTKLAADFRRARPGVEVEFHFGGTQQLRTQVEHGAVADVFASADRRHMDALATAGLVGPAEVFARNEPVLVVSAAGASSIRGLADLPSASRVVLGSEEVPIGGYSTQVLERAQVRFGGDFRARVEARVVSRELNVRQVLMKVAMGEADAGIVYRSDAASVPTGVAVIAIPADLNVVAEYPVAVLRAAPAAALAQAWIDLLLSPPGREALTSAGFVPPAAAGVAP